MLLFIERHKYDLSHTVRENLTVRDILKGIVSFPKTENNYTPKYVGYCYNKEVDDVVFFLPKVVLKGDETGKKTDEENNSTIFGVSPLDIIDIDSDATKSKFTEDVYKKYKEFLSTLSIWVYRALNEYKRKNNDNILIDKEYQSVSNGQKTKFNTLFDVIIALRDFNKNNQDYFTFIAKTVHSGFNKIHWQKTINHTTPYFCKGKPIYANPVNKKKKINFDEELLIIYFSILNYIAKVYGFNFDININYELIDMDKLKAIYIGQNYGCYRLNQIKYKYFADKALLIWNLCYAFFDREHDIAINKQNKDVLLAKDFEHVFEMIIDDLLVGDEKLNSKLIKQPDGKIVDHLFTDKSIFGDSKTYYIADSKYYKRSPKDGEVSLSKESVYKQFTYAKNIIQLNIEAEIFSDTPPIKLRDPLTEGYNPIPNFFISARIPTEEEGFSFDDRQIKKQDKIYFSRQFENRFFDRDTLWLCHFDVNFLYIISLYGSGNLQNQATWRSDVREKFRNEIRQTLNKLYNFYKLTPHKGIDSKEFITKNFKYLNGKLHRPEGENDCLILALVNEKADKWEGIENIKKCKIDFEPIENNMLEVLLDNFSIEKIFL